MSLSKSLRYSEWTRPFWRVFAYPFASVLAAWFRLVERTSAVRITGGGAEFAGAAIYVNWHRHLPFAIVVHGHRRRTMMMLAAPYMDPIGLWCRWMGLRIVPGATGSGGREALARLAELIGQGESVVLAVDGPAGPAFRVKPGCVELAKATGAPIIPVSYSSRRQVTSARRWDRMLVVLPFGEIVVTMGEPIRVAPDAPIAESVERVANAMERPP